MCSATFQEDAPTTYHKQCNTCTLASRIEQIPGNKGWMRDSTCSSASGTSFVGEEFVETGQHGSSMRLDASLQPSGEFMIWEVTAPSQVEGRQGGGQACCYRGAALWTRGHYSRPSVSTLPHLMDFSPRPPAALGSAGKFTHTDALNTNMPVFPTTTGYETNIL